MRAYWPFVLLFPFNKLLATYNTEKIEPDCLLPKNLLMKDEIFRDNGKTIFSCVES